MRTRHGPRAIVTRVLRALVCAGAAAALAGPIALANMANPLQPGDQVGEPSAALRSVAVDHEDLTLDLTGLGRAPASDSTRPMVAISADYLLRNTGPATSLDLVFVAPGLQAPGASVTLDGTAVASAPGAASEFPSSWRPPTTTPAVGGGEPVPYQTRNGAVLRFALTLAPGPHHVGVHYMALPTTYDGSNPARLWQVGYVLAPARQWASFGGLALTVQVPHGWLAATSPSLQRSGDTLRATFNSVPADSLGVTAEYPAPPPAADFTVLVLAGGLVLAAVAGWIAGGWLGRRHRTSAWVLPLSIFAGAAVAAGVVLTGSAALVTGVPDDQLSRTFNYGRGTLSLGMAILALFAGVVLCQLAAAWQHHRSQRATSLPTAPHP